MNNTTYIQHLELIDISAQENRLYHYNGGQAYIRVAVGSNVLMVIDHTNIKNPTMELRDGTAYFEAYPTYNVEQSARLREHGSLVAWYVANYGEPVAV
jgi:hypothetical protein